MIKVSVIVPIYNVEKYVAQCLESIQKQTLDSFEILCIDDQSTDNSMKIVEEYAVIDNRIKIIKHSRNRGLSAARNTGLEHAKGKYIFFLDSDDMIIPETLKELYLYAEENELDEIYFNMKKVYESAVKELESIHKKIYYDYSEIYTGQKLFCLFVQDQTIKIEAWRQFYRRSFLLENNICFYEGILHEDNLFSFLCAMNAKRVMNINKEYYLYRQHKNSIMYSLNENRVKSMYIVLVEIFKYWNTHIFSDEINKAIAFYFESLYSVFFYYKDCCKTGENLGVGSYAEKSLYRLLLSKPQQYATLSEEKLLKLKKAKHIIIFGAGRAAHQIIQKLQKENISIEAVAVSDTEVTAKNLGGLKVRKIEELLEYRTLSIIVVGVTKKYCKEVEEQLIDLGFENLMLSDECEEN